MGVAYYANYLVWMELGRVEYCRAAGLRYRDLEEHDGILLTVVEARCRYHASARYDDEIVVKAWIGEASPRMVRFDYEIRRAEDGRRLATGYTKHVFCSRDLKPTRLPAKYHALFSVR